MPAGITAIQNTARMLLASLGAGWLWDREGASATFLTSAAVAAVALAMLSLLEEEPRVSA